MGTVLQTMATKHDFHKLIIGRIELLDFPDLDLRAVTAKTDTGANRSAIHAADIILGDDGVLRFDLLKGHYLGDAYTRHVETKDFTVVTIENSFGVREDRYQVKLRAKLGPKVFMTTFTLANRAKKVCPILIGCSMLDDRFLVDTSQSAVDIEGLRLQYGLDTGDETDSRSAVS